MKYRPLLLDLFCGAGGAAVGYHRAGFDVFGVDIAPQPHYPFDFVQDDAVAYLARYGRYFDVIHASPPCQAYSVTSGMPKHREYPKLIETIRDALIVTGRPYVIENVMGAPLHTVIVLCGAMFGLRVYRHRSFESSHMIFQPGHVPHIPGQLGGYRKGLLPRKAPRDWDGFITVAGNNFYLDAARRAMGIDWMQRSELAEAIPPAYTEYIGAQLINILRAL